MQEEYREKLVSIALSDTTEPLIEQKSTHCIACFYILCCKKPFRYIIKNIKRLVCCFTEQTNKQI